MISGIVSFYLKNINMIDFSKKNIIITGAGGKIGFELSSYFYHQNANLILIEKNSDKLISLKNKFKKSNIYNCDLEKLSSIKNTLKKINKSFSVIDTIIHTASLVGTSELIGWNTKFSNQSISNFDKSFKINVSSIFFIVQQLQKNLNKSKNPSIINIGSIYGKITPDWSMYKNTNINNPAGYSTTKAALLYLTKWLAKTVSPKIRCNMISPGGLEGNQSKLFKKKYINKVPLKRMTTAKDLIGPTIFLSSEMSKYITGQNIFVDGGFSL